MVSDECCVAEFKALRDEILTLYNRGMTGLQISWAAAAALIAGAVNWEAPELAALGLVMVALAYDLHRHCAEMQEKIGSYILVMIERRCTGFGWQSALDKLTTYQFGMDKAPLKRMAEALCSLDAASCIACLIATVTLAVQCQNGLSVPRWIGLILLSLIGVAVFCRALERRLHIAERRLLWKERFQQLAQDQAK